MSVAIPQWLKLPHPRQPIARYEPENLLFIPQRRVVSINARPHLLDYRDRAYLLSRCAPPELGHLNGVADFVAMTGEIYTVYRRGKVYVCSDGQRQIYLDLDSGLVAARSLAAQFEGSIYSEEVA